MHNYLGRKNQWKSSIKILYLILLPLRNFELNLSLQVSTNSRSLNKTVSNTFVLRKFKQHSKWVWQNAFSSFIFSLCIILQQSKSNGLTEISFKGKTKSSQNQNKTLLQRKFSEPGDELQMWKFSDTTKISLTLRTKEMQYNS